MESGLLDHRGLDAGQMQGLADFEADQTAADHNRAAHLPLIADGAQRVGIAERMQGMDTGQLGSGHLDGKSGTAPVAITSRS
jgi:hypothetical protein